MPRIEFYAVQADIAKILEFVFAETDCRVYEAYSVPEQPLRVFDSVEQVLGTFAFDHEVARVSAVQLVLWSPTTGPEPTRRRIDLAPAAAGGATHRFVLEAWGLIQLLAGGVRGGRIDRSGLAHNSEARARAWERTSRDRLGLVEAWDWVALSRVARRLTYHVGRRLAVAKQGSWPVLPGAQAARQSGLQLA